MESKVRLMGKIFLAGAFSTIIAGWMGYSLTDENVSHDVFAGLLQKHVQNGLIDYKGFKSDETILDTYLEILEHVDPEKLSRNDRFSFYINAYNAWTIKLILTGYPGLKSIKDLGGLFGSPWKKRICRIDGKILTLDEIEHNILRPEFKDPRVHFAINCASRGCPPLITEPYEGDILEQQLDEAARAFINNPAFNRLEGTTLFLSQIFNWFKDDFDNDALEFVLKYADEDLRKRLLADQAHIKLKFLDYDWSLNG